jgi:hypothetical protein
MKWTFVNKIILVSCFRVFSVVVLYRNWKVRNDEVWNPIKLLFFATDVPDK